MKLQQYQPIVKFEIVNEIEQLKTQKFTDTIANSDTEKLNSGACSWKGNTTETITTNNTDCIIDMIPIEEEVDRINEQLDCDLALSFYKDCQITTEELNELSELSDIEKLIWYRKAFPQIESPEKNSCQTHWQAHWKKYFALGIGVSTGINAVSNFIATPPLRPCKNNQPNKPNTTQSTCSNFDYLSDSHSNICNLNWMKSIKNDTKLTDISIPGTHNSCSMYGGDITRTQSLSIEQQLSMGIRYLDARFKYVNGDLCAYHGPINQHQTFSQFTSTVNNFLEKNPSETVIIRMKNEAGEYENKEAFQERFNTTLSECKHFKQLSFEDGPDITLGKVRGSFIFMRDFWFAGGRLGYHYSDVYRQDQFILKTNWDLPSKWENIKLHLDNRLANYNGTVFHNRTLSLNHLSGSSGVFPYFVASGKSSPSMNAPQLWTGQISKNCSHLPDFQRGTCFFDYCTIDFSGTNHLTSDWLAKQEKPRNVGIIAADFPGERLIDRIIAQNKDLCEKDLP